MNQQLIIPSSSECSRCGLKSSTSEMVYETFGVRLVNGQIVAQSQCKKCKSLHLTKELKAKLDNYKEQIKKETEHIVQEWKKDHDELYNKTRDEYKTKLEQINSILKEHKQKRDREDKAKIEAKRQELYNELKK